MTQAIEPRNWPARKPGEPLYICKVNPHDNVECVKHQQGEHDLWRCGHCGMEGTLDALDEIPCPVIRPPCPHCGQTPICAWDCKGIWTILGDPRIYIAGVTA